MAPGRARSHTRRGSTLVESSVVAVVFLLLLTGTMEVARLGFAYNEVSFAAQSAARYASVSGSSSGHVATAAGIQSVAETYTGALDNTQVTVTTTWSPNNNPGSTVQVKVSYNFATVLVPLSPAGALTVQTTASSIITQ
jgi:Flp pilus assembly protein TadG